MKRGLGGTLEIKLLTRTRFFPAEKLWATEHKKHYRTLGAVFGTAGIPDTMLSVTTAGFTPFFVRNPDGNHAGRRFRPARDWTAALGWRQAGRLDSTAVLASRERSAERPTRRVGARRQELADEPRSERLAVSGWLDWTVNRTKVVDRSAECR